MTLRAKDLQNKDSLVDHSEDIEDAHKKNDTSDVDTDSGAG